jgi:hypothetical protein
MHKSVSPFDRTLLDLYFTLKRAGRVTGAKYMAVQALCRPTLQPRRPSEPVRPHRQRALSAAGPRR